jgi:hypothetical protein
METTSVRPSVRPPFCLWPSITELTVCRVSMKLVVGVLHGSSPASVSLKKIVLVMIMIYLVGGGESILSHFSPIGINLVAS